LAAVIALLAAQSPAYAWEPPKGAGQPSPNDCIADYAGSLASSTGLADYKSGAQIHCGRPGNTAPYGGNVFTSSAPAPDGSPCQVLYYAPVKFQNLPTHIYATWQSPVGVPGSANISPYSYGLLLDTVGGSAAENDVFVVFVQSGKYQAGQCQSEGGWDDYCAAFQSGTAVDPCIYARPHIYIRPHTITPAQSPPPAPRPYVARVVGDLKARAGTLASLPSPNGLVNLPTCFWIDDIAVPDERDFTMVLPGPPDDTNRRIYYTYLIRVFFAGVDWNFDDPFGNDQVLPHPACGQRPQMTAHSYQMISEKHSADGYYHVSATEKYQVTVDLYWDDSYGTHHQGVDPGVPLPITVSPAGPYNQYVGQVEGIPVSG
jgi:hypothetical protein